METFSVPKLQHLASSRIFVSLFNNLEVQKKIPVNESAREKYIYETLKFQVKEAVARLTSSTLVQKKLEVFIDPLLQEIEDCVDLCTDTEYGFRKVPGPSLEGIPLCWLSDGTINREKVARLIVKKKNLGYINRFIFACTFCLFSDALEAWDALYNTEKAYLKLQSTAIVKLWIEWFESSSTKDWESFLAWSLGTPLWHSSVYILKHSLRKISPAERSHYLLSALIEKKVDDDVMRFCLSVMTQDEQAQIFRESTAQVFSCILSWPLRPMFFVVADKLWPYFTEQSFCEALLIILNKILKQKTEDVELLNIVEYFWAESPEHFQNAAKDDRWLLWRAEDIWDTSKCLLDRGLPQGFWKVFLRKCEPPLRIVDDDLEIDVSNPSIVDE